MAPSIPTKWSIIKPLLQGAYKKAIGQTLTLLAALPYIDIQTFNYHSVAGIKHVLGVWGAVILSSEFAYFNQWWSAFTGGSSGGPTSSN